MGTTNWGPVSHPAFASYRDQSGMIIEVILLVVLVGALLYRWITKSFDKWERLGIVHEKPAFPYGTHNFLDGKKHMNEFTTEDYKKYKQEQKLKVHGWFLLGKPVLSINDVDIIKQIQVKDFNSFVDRNEANFARSFNRGAKLDRVLRLSEDTFSKLFSHFLHSCGVFHWMLLLVTLGKISGAPSPQSSPLAR